MGVVTHRLRTANLVVYEMAKEEARAQMYLPTGHRALLTMAPCHRYGSSSYLVYKVNIAGKIITQEG